MSFSMIAIAVHLAGTQLPPTADTPLTRIADSVPADEQAEEIVVQAKASSTPGDPLQALNAESFAIIQTMDKAVTGPVARGYKKTVPSPIRSGLRNALRNLQEPVVSLNYLLQLKPGKSAETLGRFAINSTIGVAGVFGQAVEVVLRGLQPSGLRLRGAAVTP